MLNESVEHDSPSSFGSDSKGQAGRWKVELRLAKKEQESWVTRCNKIIERYRDEEVNSFKRYGKRFNILWSNVQTLQPAIYSQTPKPQVDRRYKDKDRIGRLAAQILERTLSFLVQPETFDRQMISSRDDYLLTGRGQLWLRYVPTMVRPKVPLNPDQFSLIGAKGSQYEDYSMEDLHEGEEGAFIYGPEEVHYEEVEIDKVHWRDFLHSPARCWEEVRWVAKRVFMRRDELIQRFGEERGKDIPLSFSSESAKKEAEGVDATEQEAFKKAEVWEIWDKESRKVFWVCDGYDELLDSKPDPLKLSGFFPCPRPLYSTLTSGSLIPIPDFVLYQDQANEMDELTTRINLLTKSIRVAGVYDKGNLGIQRLLTEHAENELIPVDGWSRMAERGGLRGVVDFLPIETAAQVADILYRAREQTKQEIYEITGISDVFRGASHPRETAAAQQIKAQFGSTRLQERQSKMQNFAREIIAIIAEIVAEHFDPNTIWQMGGVSLLEEGISQEDFAQAVALLKDETTRSFRIDIETDSTIAINRELEKKARVEAVNGIGGFIKQATELVRMEPEMWDFAVHTIMFAARSFKAGRNLEGSLEQALERIQQKREEAKKQPPPPPPEVQKLQQQMQLEQQKMQQTIQLEQQKLQLKQQELQQELQLKQEETARELELKAQEQQAKIQLKREEALADLDLKRQELQMEAEIELAKLNNQLNIEIARHNGTLVQDKPVEPDLKVAKFTTDENGDRIAVISNVK